MEFVQISYGSLVFCDLPNFFLFQGFLSIFQPTGKGSWTFGAKIGVYGNQTFLVK